MAQSVTPLALSEETQCANLAILSEDEDTFFVALRELAYKLNLPFVLTSQLEIINSYAFFLTYRDDCLMLLDVAAITKPGLFVGIDHRQGEQKSWPIAKTGALAHALGRKTKSIVDATAGWGQDSLAMFRMGYEVICIERSPIMAALLADGFRRLSEQHWMRLLELAPPQLVIGNAIEMLEQLPYQPDCIYLDPMFPPKRKKSALAKKSIMLLRELVGEDDDKTQLFETALTYAGKRVVVKSPDYAAPLGGKPNESFQGKLIRYDVYFK
jgi:16S rRNA (guanine1516-N2)-methyltransferase